MGRKSRRKRDSKRDGLLLFRSNDTHAQHTASIERPFAQVGVLVILVSLFLILATLVVYWQVLNHDFVNFDDPEYVTENPHVQMGLTQESVVWAFTAFHSGNWHPFTWLSHMLDCQLFGLKPGMHHLTNLLLHITNTLLLFLLLQRMTGRLWQSAFVAALFGLHPLHSESVAWVSERKDVLSTFLWMLTVGFYLRYVERHGLSRYLLVLLFFALGLMAKPMLVTLPFVLLLIDYWPLGRLRFSKSCKESNLHIQKSQAFRLVWEKAPFFALSAASSFVTVLAQQEGKLVESLHAVPLKMRIANALVSYASYIAKMIWPQDLAVFYPLPETIPMWKTAAAGLLLICLSIVLIRAWRRFPYLGVGWLWYLGTLVPVIGLVHVGGQAMANRYTYIPFVGLFMLIGWGLPDLLGRWHYRRIALGILGVVVLAVLMECTRLQLRHWENSVALWKHTANVTDNNYSAHSMLAAALVERGRFEEAIASASTSLKIKHDFTEACNNLGLALCKQGKLDEGIVSFAKAIQIKPGYAKAHNNLGSALALQGNLNKAVVHFSEALRIDPNLANAQIGIASALARQGRLKEAINHLSKALEIKPNNAEVHNDMGVALAQQGRLNEAIDHFSKALRIRPDNLEVRDNLTRALRLAGKSGGMPSVSAGR